MNSTNHPVYAGFFIVKNQLFLYNSHDLVRIEKSDSELSPMNLTQVRELLSQDTVSLWTIQNLAAWRLVEERGELRADGRRLCFEDFRPAYQWLIVQMNQRIPNYPGCYPVWAWPEKPDMRERAHAPAGTEIVRIQFELPRSQVLFSDFSCWHSVLSGYYIGKSEHAEKCYEALVRSARVSDPMTGLQRRADTQLVQSWQRIFDFDFLAQYPDWFGEDLRLQATTAKVPLGAIKKVEHFVAR